MRFIAALLLLALTSLPLTTHARTALVIGNGAYASAPLINPVNDATDIAAKLRTLGFEVTMLIDASRREMRRAVRKYSDQLRRNRGVGMFYYAGHGMQIKGVNYLIPTDAVMANEFEIPDEAVSANSVLRALEEAGNELNIVVLDACRDNPFAKSYRSAATRGLARMDAPGGSIVAYATAPGDVASDGDGRNGVYTKHLLANMDRRGMAIEQMFKKVRIGVIDDSGGNQTPWEESSLRSDFYFSPAEVYEVNLPQNALVVTPQSSSNTNATLPARGTVSTGQQNSGFVALPSAVQPATLPAQNTAPAPVETEVASIAPAASDVEIEVERLLVEAENAIDEVRLTTPRNHNAVYYYRQVLQLDPVNFDAHDGLQSVGRRYAALAQRELNRRDSQKAKVFIDRGLSIAPGSNKLLSLQKQADQVKAQQNSGLIEQQPEPEQQVAEAESAPAAAVSRSATNQESSVLREDVNDIKKSFKSIGSSLRSGFGGMLKFGKAKKTRGND